MLAKAQVSHSIEYSSGTGFGSCQVDPPPAAAGQITVGFAEGDGFRGPQRGVVEAAVERFQVLAAGALGADPGEQGAGLGGAGHDAVSVRPVVAQ
jgi:hypothetical protein